MITASFVWRKGGNFIRISPSYQVPSLSQRPRIISSSNPKANGTIASPPAPHYFIEFLLLILIPNGSTNSTLINWIIWAPESLSLELNPNKIMHNNRKQQHWILRTLNSIFLAILLLWIIPLPCQRLGLQKHDDNIKLMSLKRQVLHSESLQWVMLLNSFHDLSLTVQLNSAEFFPAVMLIPGIWTFEYLH